jgi:hypothetical protein
MGHTTRGGNKQERLYRMKARLRMMQRPLRIKASLPQRKRTSFSLEEEEEREQVTQKL